VPARRALSRASDEARGLRHSFVGTEHILLALVADRDGAAVRILQQLDADPVAIRSALSS